MISHPEIGAGGNFEEILVMSRLIGFTVLANFMLCSFALSQPQMTVEEYIDTYKETALEEMRKYRIPASITLAQGILESGNGNSDLARLANNHFGIKCHKEWTGKTFHKDDDAKDECFRAYKSAKESYYDHSLFLTSRDRYQFLFDLELSDYKAWANGLKQAGYATNPRYAEMLIRIIEENGLAELDKGADKSPSAVSRPSSDKNRDYRAKSSDSRHKKPVPLLNAKAPEVFGIAGKGGNDRIIFTNNKTRFILAREGDDLFKIADEFGIYSWQVREYNEMDKKSEIRPGDKIYLGRKRSRAEFEYHIIEEGETLKSISQDFGVRMKSLARMNRLEDVDKIMAGEILKLK